MAEADIEATITRLRRVEGQVRGLQRMLSEGRECEDVLTQLMAVRSGLEQVSLLLLDHHVRDCLLGGADVEPERLEGLRQTLRMWARFGAPAAQIPD
jgi:CsoR family transcriptional regulator, copper-sensing transcriptional repressor